MKLKFVTFAWSCICFVLITSSAFAHGGEVDSTEVFRLNQLPIVIVYVAIVIGGAILLTRVILWKTYDDADAPDPGDDISDDHPTDFGP